MDPITTAILAALTDDALGKATATGHKPTIEAYQALKEALQQKFGPGSDLVDAVEKLEAKPASFGRKELLKEEMVAAQADQDPALVAAAQRLLDSVTANKPQPEPPARPFAAPLQRPARARHFVERQTELAQLLANLRPGQVVALQGPAGIGKSTLAAEAIWTLAPGEELPATFPDGIIYHNFYDQPRTDIALEEIARLFGEEPTPTPYDAAQRVLAQRQALLVLQGAEQADDLPGVLALRGGCGVLMTSQHTHPGVTKQQDIGPLSPEQALTLLQAWSEVQAIDKTVAQKIYELVGGLPLAIRLIGCFLSAKKELPVNYLNWLETTPLPNMAWSQRQQASIPLLLEYTLAQVSETAQQILAVVGLLALVPFDEQIVAETLAIEANQGLLATIRKIFKQKSEENTLAFRQAMIELSHYGLLRQIGRRCQVTHVSIYNYAQAHLSAPPKAIRRLAAAYVALAWEQSTLGPEGYAKLDANRPHIMKVLAGCLQWEDWEAAYSLAAAIEDYLDRQGYWAERVITNEVGLITAWQLGRPNEGAWLSNLGDTYRTMGHARWAIKHFEKALATARQTGDPHSKGNSLGNLGLAYRDLGQLDLARQYLEQALIIFEEIRSPSAKFVRNWLADLEEK